MFQGTTFSQTSTFTHRNDSSSLAPLSTWGRIQRQTDKIITSNVFQMTYIGVPLIVSGLIIKNEDDHFQSLRNTYIPNFRYHYDDYLQYLCRSDAWLKNRRCTRKKLLVPNARIRSHHRQYHGSNHQYGETYGKCHPSRTIIPAHGIWPPPCCIKNTGRPVALGIV